MKLSSVVTSNIYTFSKEKPAPSKNTGLWSLVLVSLFVSYYAIYTNQNYKYMRTGEKRYFPRFLSNSFYNHSVNIYKFEDRLE